MFKNTYQSGLLSIFYSCGSNPLAIWDSEVHNGHIKRVTDQEVNSIVLEIVSTNVATTYISCPKNDQVLGIRLPYLVMIVKNMKRYFSFEITILDDKNMRRRFRISNFQSTTKIRPFCTTMPIGLSGGWNQIQFNLADFTRRAYGTSFIESLRVQVHANARLRRIYFADRLYNEEELPQEYKLYLPLDRKKKKKEEKKEAAPPAEGVPPAGVPSAVGVAPAEGLPPTAVPSKAASLEKKKSIIAPPSEAAPAEDAAAAPAEAAVEGAPPAEGEAAPATDAAAAEGEAAPVEGGEAAAPAAEGEVTVEEGAAPAEGEAAPPEGAPAESAPEEGAPPAEGEAPPAEAAAEAPAEAPAAAPEEPPAEAAPAEEAPAEAPPAE